MKTALLKSVVLLAVISGSSFVVWKAHEGLKLTAEKSTQPEEFVSQNANSPSDLLNSDSPESGLLSAYSMNPSEDLQSGLDVSAVSQANANLSGSSLSDPFPTLASRGNSAETASNTEHDPFAKMTVTQGQNYYEADSGLELQSEETHSTAAAEVGNLSSGADLLAMLSGLSSGAASGEDENSAYSSNETQASPLVQHEMSGANVVSESAVAGSSETLSQKRLGLYSSEPVLMPVPDVEKMRVSASATLGSLPEKLAETLPEAPQRLPQTLAVQNAASTLDTTRNSIQPASGEQMAPMQSAEDRSPPQDLELSFMSQLPEIPLRQNQPPAQLPTLNQPALLQTAEKAEDAYQHPFKTLSENTADSTLEITAETASATTSMLTGESTENSGISRFSELDVAPTLSPPAAGAGSRSANPFEMAATSEPAEALPTPANSAPVLVKMSDVESTKAPKPMPSASPFSGLSMLNELPAPETLQPKPLEAVKVESHVQSSTRDSNTERSNTAEPVDLLSAFARLPEPSSNKDQTSENSASLMLTAESVESSLHSSVRSSVTSKETFAEQSAVSSMGAGPELELTAASAPSNTARDYVPLVDQPLPVGTPKVNVTPFKATQSEQIGTLQAATLPLPQARMPAPTTPTPIEKPVSNVLPESPFGTQQPESAPSAVAQATPAMPVEQDLLSQLPTRQPTINQAPAALPDAGMLELELPSTPKALTGTTTGTQTQAMASARTLQVEELSLPRSESTQTTPEYSQIDPEVVIEKIAPPEAVIGHQIIYEIKVRNIGQVDVSEVVVEDQVPTNVSNVATSPVAQQTGDRLVWQLGTMRAGDEKLIRIRVTPTSAGQIGSVAVVRFGSSLSTAMQVAARSVKLEVMDIPEIIIGNHAQLRFQIENLSQTPINGLVLRSVLPPGIRHPRGNDIEYEIGTLRAGGVATADMVVTPERVGDFRISAEIANDANVLATVEKNLVVIQSRLELRRSTIENRYLGRSAPSITQIRNHSREPLFNVRVVETLPVGIEPTTIPQNANWDSERRQLVWTFDQLGGNESREVSSSLIAMEGGNKTGSVIATDSSGARAEVKTNLNVTGFAELNLDLTSGVRTVMVGDRVNVRLRVKNDGSAPAMNLHPVFEIPAEMKVHNAVGSSRSKTEGNEVIFHPVASLDVGQELNYEVVLTGVAAGTKVVRVKLVSEDFPEGILRDRDLRVISRE